MRNPIQAAAIALMDASAAAGQGGLRVQDVFDAAGLPAPADVDLAAAGDVIAAAVPSAVITRTGAARVPSRIVAPPGLTVAQLNASIRGLARGAVPSAE